MPGVFVSLSASGRSPSMEMSATRGGGGGVGVGVGVATGSGAEVGMADGWVSELPHAAMTSIASAATAADHNREWCAPIGSATMASPSKLLYVTIVTRFCV
jgi:hypothetical protein